MNKATFHCITFGCQMNVTDSDWLQRSLVARGFTPAPYGEAQIYILNTCSVRDKAEHKVYSEIGMIRRDTGDDRDILICVGGCVAQQAGPRIFQRFRQVRLVFGTDGIAAAPDAIEQLWNQRSLRLSLLDFTQGYEERDPLWAPSSVAPASCVTIMQGCDNYCSYCIVPYVRGRQKSRSSHDILEECRTLLTHGAREITLLGQNVNSFGQDAGADGVSFTRLLYTLAELPRLERLRFVTAHPKDLPPELIRAFGELPLLAPRLHLPLQSGSDRILERMGRKYTRARYMDLVEKLRAARPDLQFSTDIIVGFPGETEDDFQQTLSCMREVGFVGSFSFPYSSRPGTRAAAMPDMLDKTVKLERLARLQSWQYDHAAAMLRHMHGARVEVLLEEEETKHRPGENITETRWRGREAKGHSVTVTLEGPAPAGGWRGAMVGALVTDTGPQTVRARQEGQPW